MGLLRLYFAQRRTRRLLLSFAALTASLAAAIVIGWSYTQDLVGWQFSFPYLSDNICLKRAGAGRWAPVESLNQTQVQVDVDMQPTPLCVQLPKADVAVFHDSGLRLTMSLAPEAPVVFVQRATIKVDHVPTTVAQIDPALLRPMLAQIDRSGKEEPDPDVRAKFKSLGAALRNQDQTTRVIFWPGVRLCAAAYTQKYWRWAAPVLAVPWLLIAASLIRLSHRQRHDLCLACGYKRSGLPSTDPCPECGQSPDLRPRTPAPIIAECDEHSPS